MATTEEQKQEIENFNNIRQALLLSTPDSQALFAHFFNQGVQNGLDHSVPSKKTMEELSNIKISQARHEEKLDTVISTLGGHILDEKNDKVELMNEFKLALEKFVEKVDTTYVKKESMKYVYITVGTVGSVIGFGILVINFILNHK